MEIMDEILEQIAHLENDKTVCYDLLKHCVDPEEKSEIRKKIRANLHELMRLKSLFISLRGDELMYGGKYDK